MYASKQRAKGGMGDRRPASGRADGFPARSARSRDLACRGLFEPVGRLYGAQPRSSAHVAPDPGRDSIRSGFGAFGQVRVAYIGRREPKAAHFRSGHAWPMRVRFGQAFGRSLPGTDAADPTGVYFGISTGQIFRTRGEDDDWSLPCRFMQSRRSVRTPGGGVKSC